MERKKRILEDYHREEAENVLQKQLQGG